MTTCDFVIVKATGGAGCSNGCFKKHADETLAAGKLLGCYHYARDRGYEGAAIEEADWFIAAFEPYVGKAIPFLDWEADALALGPAWAKAWPDRVRAVTGVTPGIYTSKSVLFSHDWASVATVREHRAHRRIRGPPRPEPVLRNRGRLAGAGTTKTSVDIDAMARAVIRGDCGNGDERRCRLGSYYAIVQARVNEMLA